MRLDKIYTRGGDAGETSLGDGSRLSKAHIRIETIGALDESNAALGVALLHVEQDAMREILIRVQHDLFDLGGDLCMPEKETAKTPLRVTAAQVARLESDIDRFNAALAPLTSFVLPGGGQAAAYLHLARTIVRRAERLMVALNTSETINAEAVKYVNRLSDLLFVLARSANDEGRADVLWRPGFSR
jgi:cob(I)alamin adenosyltransferase